MIKAYVQYYEKEKGLYEEIKTYSKNDLITIDNVEIIKELEDNENVYSYNILITLIGQFKTILYYGTLEDIEKFISDNRMELKQNNYELGDDDLIQLFCDKYPYYDINKLFY